MWEFLTSPEGPWWGEASIAGAFVIIGALLSLITSSLVERSKAKRDLARRFDNEIREAGAAFLTKADDYFEKAKEYQKAVQRPADSKDYTTNLREARAVKRSARQEVAKALQPLSFVAPNSLIRAARVHNIRITTADMGDETLTETTRQKVAASRQRVVDEVRRTIKLPVSKPSRWKNWRKQVVAKAKQLSKKTWLVVIVAALLVFVAGFWFGSFQR